MCWRCGVGAAIACQACADSVREGASPGGSSRRQLVADSERRFVAGAEDCWFCAQDVAILCGNCWVGIASLAIDRFNGPGTSIL